MKRLFHRFAAGLAFAAGWVGTAGLASPPPVRWVIAERDLDLGAWRGRLAIHGEETWAGGGPASESSPGDLYRYDGERWHAAPPVGVVGARTFVLAFDPAGQLWVSPYSPNSENVYDRLDLRRWDGGAWHREILEPGIWPQAMAWPSAEEGWIAGNHGMFYHRTGGRWRIETLDLPPAERRDRNILALHMISTSLGWAAGSRGLVARYGEEEGRLRWRALPVPRRLAAANFEALDVTPDGRLWLAGDRGTLAARDRDGRWRMWKVPEGIDLLAIDMLDDGQGWAVGSNGTILHFDGQAWRRIPSPTRSTLTDVRMTGQTTGWIAGGAVLLRAVTEKAPRFDDLSNLVPALSSRGAEQAAAVDADLDGDLDLFTAERGALHLFENRKGRWVEAPPPPALPGDEIAPPAIAWGDADGDGRLDLVALGRRNAAIWLLRQGSRLGFDPPAPLPVGPSGGLADTPWLVDLDADGALDLYLARSSRLRPPDLPDLIYRGDGAGGWHREPGSPGDRGVERLVLWGDVDGDLDLDLVLAGDDRRPNLWRNERGRLLRAARNAGLDPGPEVGPAGQGALWDLDRDGDLDLLLLGDRLLAWKNDGRGRFAPVLDWFDPLENRTASAESQVAIGDLDHDGYAEILLAPVAGSGARIALFSRGPAGRYRDRAAAAGIRDLAGRTALFADVDGDGDLDLFAGDGRRAYLLANRQDDRGFLKVRVRGVGDPLARGAQVRVYEAGRLGEAAALLGFQAVGVGLPGSGVTHLSELHFGVPPSGRFDLETRFLGGRRVVTRGVTAGRTVVVYEQPWGLRTLALAGRRTTRAVRRADLLREALWAALAVALALAVRGPLARRFRAETFCPRAICPVLLVALHLAASVVAIDGPRGLSGVAPRGAAPTLALLLLGTDRALTRYRNTRRARHLGPYRLLDPLGEGGMGAVWKARHLVSGRRVALKLLHPRITANETHRRRLLREGALLADIDHPNIVRVYETGEVDGQGYVSMEILDGRPLREAFAAEGHSPGGLPPRAVASFLAVAADALAAVAGRGIVHRDVKTDNFFVLGTAPLPQDLAGWRARLRLMDFGLASGREMPALTADHAILGTLAYLAPEVLRGEATGPRSDLYSLGAVAFEIATGRLPGEGDFTLPEDPPGLADLIRRLLAADPALRPGSAARVARAAEAIASGALPAIEPAAAPDEPVRPESDLGERLARAREHQREGREVEAHILVVELLSEIRGRLEGLPPRERVGIANTVRLDELIDLERTLRPGAP